MFLHVQQTILVVQLNVFHVQQTIFHVQPNVSLVLVCINSWIFAKYPEYDSIKTLEI